jgi:HAD superfamily phosphoserine phosphatase-like hydrolase
MNIYDFDKTIYSGDSSLDFFMWCLLKRPSIIVLLKTSRAAIKYVFGVCGKEEVKSAMFSALQRFPDKNSLVREFWDTHEKNIYSWYPEKKKSDDIIISASPDFLLCEIADRLGFRLIATEGNILTGEITGPNCYGEEKVRRLEREIGVNSCEEFYSDSLSDAPLASIAEKAFLVKKGKPRNWPHNSK